jgi:glycosyltransferase involved in cell wall biosynthesis
VLGRLRALSYLGHEVDLLTYHLGSDVTLPGVSIVRIPSVPGINTVAIGPSAAKLMLDVLVLIKAVCLLLGRRYDLLHTHEEASFFGMVLAKCFRVSHLYDMHSSLPQQLQNFRHCLARPLSYLFRWLERRAIRSSDALITICPALAEHVRMIDDQVPHAMIENVASEAPWIEMTPEAHCRIKAQYGLPDQARIVLYTGTFEAYQGLDLLIESLARVVQVHRDAILLLVGGTPHQVRQYQQQARARGLVDHVHFLGVQPPHAIPAFLQLADVLVSPRTHGTNTPLKLYAYLRAGKPIVATDLPMHTQILTSEVAALVPALPEAFAQGILDVCENPAWAQQLGQHAQELFQTHYTFDTFVHKTDQLLRQVGLQTAEAIQPARH